MKLGLGLTPQHLTDDNLRYTVQLGVTHLFVNGVDLGEHTFEFDQLLRLRSQVESFGLTLAGIENFPERYWSDVLRDRQSQQWTRVLSGHHGRDGSRPNRRCDPSFRFPG